jgi:phosphoribosylformylglycinamidine (FGAM) synthase-like enzyme/phosphoribosylformylglycinamidine (FGAM) synthase PurS component
VTKYQVEVRAVAGQHDVQAQRLAREILHIPLTRLPSLAALRTNSTSLTIHTSHLYLLTGTITTSHIDQLTGQLLVDPVIQQASDAELSRDSSYHVVDVFFHPGVTDTLAESVLAGAHMLGITGLEQVETGQRYTLDGRLSASDVRTIVEELLYNPVIQQYTLWPAHTTPGALNTQPAPGAAAPPAHVTRITQPVRSIPLSTMTDQQLLELSRAGMLALDLDEMRAIQQHYQAHGREPTDVELETLAQTWSEHCSHKTFKATIDYQEVDSDGTLLRQETIQGLLKQYIMRATEAIKRPWVVSAFSDNAGIIRFTDSQDIAFKVETHNHPSAIEPFGGANTGVGGVIRDVLGVSAQPIACTDILCFGPPETAVEELPAGVLTPRRIASGVVNGVRDYGNKMGIPTVNGAVLYHPGYIYNPLVFCGCLGILPHGGHPDQAQPGDRIVVLGGRTGRDGIHGATFSSGEMSSEINAQAGSAVQIGAPITEKKVADVIVQARDLRLYHAITDCGAGGFSSAIGEMGARTGARVELAHAPLKYQGLAPWEIWLSEAQERMVLAVPPEHLETLLAICATEEVEPSVIGTFTNDHRLVVTYNDQPVAAIDMAFLHDGRPNRSLKAVWTQPQPGHPSGETSLPSLLSFPVGARVAGGGGVGLYGRPLSPPVEVTPYGILSGGQAGPLVPPNEGRPDEDLASARIEASPGDHVAATCSTVLLALLRHPTIASKEQIVRRYDHEVQGATVLKPLVGAAGNGPGDAAVLQPFFEALHPSGGTSLPSLPSLPVGAREEWMGGVGLYGRPLSPPVEPGRPSRAAIVLSNGINPLYGKIDPYAMAANAIDEALRNLTAVGGDVERAAILDNFCWGNPTDPLQLGLLVRAVKGCHDAALGFGAPFISGKDSLNNEYRTGEQRLPVIPTLLISAVGVIDDAAQTIDMSLKSPGSLLYQLGATHNALAGSHYLEYLADPAFFPATTVPQVNVPYALALMKALGAAIRQGLVRACHDLSEGGLAVAAAEMSLAGLLGIDIDLEQVPHDMHVLHDNLIDTLLLFSESASRFLLEVAPEQRAAFEAHMRSHGVQDIACIGVVASTGRFTVRSGEQVLIDLTVADLQQAWKGEEA